MSTYTVPGNFLHVFFIVSSFFFFFPTQQHIQKYTKNLKFTFLFFFIFHQEEIEYVLASVGGYVHNLTRKS